jgi:hypothetical protein
MKSLSAQLDEAREEVLSLRSALDAVLFTGDAVCDTAIRSLAGETPREGATQLMRAFRRSLQARRVLHLNGKPMDNNSLKGAPANDQHLKGGEM